MKTRLHARLSLSLAAALVAATPVRAEFSLELQMARGMNWQQAPSAAQLLGEHKSAVNRGDAAGAVAMLADDVRYVAGAFCPPAHPCVGKAQVLKRLVEPLIARKTRIATGVTEGNDAIARVRLELTWPGIEERGVQRLIGFDEVRARDGLITSVTYMNDLNDAQTAAFVKANSAAAAAVAGGTTPSK